MNPQEKMEEKWNPVLTIEAVIMSITSMLADPNLDSPANIDAAKMLKDDKKGYTQKVRKLAIKSMDDF